VVRLVAIPIKVSTVHAQNSMPVPLASISVVITTLSEAMRIAEVPSNELTRFSGNSNLFRDGWRAADPGPRTCGMGSAHGRRPARVAQTREIPVPQQTIVVVDYNVELYKRLIFTVSDLVILENTGPKGLSGARNTGTASATAGIIAFLDDHAEAAPDWLERVTALYTTPMSWPWAGGLCRTGKPVTRTTSARNLD
jgi:hypothetical protein